MPFQCIRCKSEIDPAFKVCPFCGEAVTDFIRQHQDALVEGKYQILSVLGAGGMGEVYKVLHVHLNAPRVIKLMRAKIAEDPDAHERFQREARLATRINHPNVATLFDFSTLADGSRYMVWEYIEGKNLHQLIAENGPLSPRHAATVAHEALMGLEAIHRAGIIHRDISPENIMVSVDEHGEEHVKIIDLGIAKQWGEETQQTMTGVFVGKWKYCSPEHLGLLQKGTRIDARADLYSFGIVLYEMLTGVAPFQATTPHGFLVAHAQEQPPALRDMNPTVTTQPDFESIIFRALEKDREKRFSTAREFARAIQPLIATLDDTAGAVPPPRRIDTDDGITVPVGETPAPGNQRTAVPMGPRTEKAPDLPAETVDVPAATQALTPPPAAEPTLLQTVEVPRRPLSQKKIWYGVAAAAAVVVVALAAIFTHGGKPKAATSSMVVSAAVPAARLGLNAYPWGEVRVITNTATGRPVELKELLVTPSPIDLAPGTYEVQFSNPAFKEPIVRLVELKPGEERTISVQFSDPSTAELPQLLVQP